MVTRDEVLTIFNECDADNDGIVWLSELKQLALTYTSHQEVFELFLYITRSHHSLMFKTVPWHKNQCWYNSVWYKRVQACTVYYRYLQFDAVINVAVEDLGLQFIRSSGIWKLYPGLRGYLSLSGHQNSSGLGSDFH